MKKVTVSIVHGQKHLEEEGTFNIVSDTAPTIQLQLLAADKIEISCDLIGNVRICEEDPSKLRLSCENFSAFTIQFERQDIAENVAITLNAVKEEGRLTLAQRGWTISVARRTTELQRQGNITTYLGTVQRF